MPCDVGRLPIKGELCRGWRGVRGRDKAGDVGVYVAGGGGLGKNQ